MTIHSLTIPDLPRTAAFLATQTKGVFTEADWIGKLQWFWSDNPFAKGQTLGWAAVDDHGEIQGVLGNIPAQCVVAGEVRPSYWATSWFVNESARNLSMGMFMKYLSQRGVMMSNTPNPRVEQMLVKAFRYQRAESLWFSRSFIIPLHPLRGFATSNTGSFIKRLMMTGGLLSLSVTRKLSFIKPGSGYAKDIEIKAVSHASNETDSWYESFSKTESSSVTRTSALMNWIFCHPKHKDAFLLLEVRYKENIQGYFACKMKRHPVWGVRYVEMVDEALLPLPGDIYAAIATDLIRTIRALAGTSSLLMARSNHPEMHKVFRRTGGKPVNKVEKTYYRNPFLHNNDQPFLTSLDGDSIFF